MRKMTIEEICLRAYEILISTQNEFGEFGKNTVDCVSKHSGW